MRNFRADSHDSLPSLGRLAPLSPRDQSLSIPRAKTVRSRAVRNGSHYYTLAYSPANNKNDGRFRRIQVSLVDNNYTLSYRRGYFADQPSHEFTSQEGADDPFVPLIG